MKRAPTTRRPVLLGLLTVILSALALCALPTIAQNDTNPPQTDPPAQPAEQTGDETPADLEGPPVPPERVGPSSDSLPSLDELDKRIAIFEQAESRTDQQNIELQNLKSARSYLELAQQSSARSASLQQDAASAPQRLQTVQADRAKAAETAIPPELAAAALEELETRLQAARTDLDTEKRLQNVVESEATTRVERRNNGIPNELAAARNRLEAINDALDDAPPPDMPPAIVAARRLALQAERLERTTRVTELENELRSYDARKDLLTARRELASLRLQNADRLVNRLEQLVTDKRAAAAEQARQQAEQAARAARDQHPVLQKIAEQNSELASELVEVTERNRSQTDRRQQLEAELAKQLADYDKQRQLVKRVGLDEVFGLRLRNIRSQLPDIRPQMRAMAERSKEISRVVLRLDALSDQQSMQLDLQQEARDRLQAAEVQTDSPLYDALLARTQEALAAQNNKYLKTLTSAFDDYLENTLFVLQEQQRRLVEQTEQYNNFISERILWIQSTRPIAGEDFSETWNAIRWLASADNWAPLLAGLWRDALANLVPLIAILLIITLLLALRRRMAKALIDLGDNARSVFKAKFSHTMTAIALTMLISLPWPLLLLVIGWRLNHVAETVAFAGAISPAVLKLVAPLFVILFLWHLLRRNGVASAHFRWQPANLRLTRKVLRTVAPVALPLLFVVTAVENQPDGTLSDSLGRFAFLGLMVLMSISFGWLLSPNRGVLRNIVANTPNGWLARLRMIWFPILVLIPIALAVVAALGYFYTAQQLHGRMIFMARLIIVVLIVYALLQRWLHLVQRRVAIAESARKAEAKTGAAGEGALESGGPIEPVTLDVVALSAQTVKLLRTVVYASILIGTLVIWSDVVPAFNMLREVTLWSETGNTVLTDSSTESSGVGSILNGTTNGGESDSGANTAAVQESSSEQTQAEPARVTLADLVYALFILVITIIIARDVPGLLEFVVLQRLPITYGARYAISTITRYAIVIIGVVASFNAIGIGWSKVQFLAAAITVGLGFGLQEIFANFVSGLIILFERPIRVGDTVTVGEVNGTVSRIRMRATTITDWDRKELIIPNKEFVTGQIINWTLTDSVMRLRIAVGIAYGSDTAAARRILYEVAEKDPYVLSDPEPRVLFLDFGDNSLNFELRVFISSIEFFMVTRDSMHEAIDKAFRSAGISIAFPQRDLHIVSYPPELAAKPVDAALSPAKQPSAASDSNGKKE